MEKVRAIDGAKIVEVEVYQLLYAYLFLVLKQDYGMNELTEDGSL